MASVESYRERLRRCSTVSQLQVATIERSNNDLVMSGDIGAGVAANGRANGVQRRSTDVQRTCVHSTPFIQRHSTDVGQRRGSPAEVILVCWDGIYVMF